MNNEFIKKSYWSESWIRHIESYLNAPFRCGYWLVAQFSNQLTILEIAGGSCRDSRYLASKGFTAIGSDFDKKTLDYLKKRFPDSPLNIQCEDAFNFSFIDKSFDLTFSNGFWVCFSENQSIFRLIREQERITKKYIISFVHNLENNNLVSSFQQKSKIDALYDIRFFHRNELPALVKESGIRYKSIEIKKFGGILDRFFNKRIKRLPNPIYNLAKYFVPYLYEFQPWSKVERIALIIKLE